MWTAIFVGAVSCYGLKALGLSLPKSVIEDRRVQKIATLMPIALLSALAAMQSLSQGHHLTADARVTGVICAVVAILLRAPFLLVIAIAAAATAVARFLG
jgi:branched-subunit amino acid transport protein